MNDEFIEYRDYLETGGYFSRGENLDFGEA